MLKTYRASRRLDWTRLDRCEHPLTLESDWTGLDSTWLCWCVRILGQVERSMHWWGRGPVRRGMFYAVHQDDFKLISRMLCKHNLKGRFTHSMPRPCRAARGLECVFPIWFTRCGRVWFTLSMPCPCRPHSMLWPCRSSQGHVTARPSRDGLWATCPRSASSGYHAEFHKDCYQKHTNPPHNDPYLWL